MAEPYNQRGREGQSAKERQQQREQERTASTPEGRQLANMMAKITALEAKIAALESGSNLKAGEGISVNGNLIAVTKQWRIVGTHTCNDDGTSNFEFTIT